MNRKRGTPPPKLCKRGHNNWRVQKRGYRVCVTCLNMRVRAWQQAQPIADQQRGKRAAMAEIRAWAATNAVLCKTAGGDAAIAVALHLLVAKLDEVEKR